MSEIIFDPEFIPKFKEREILVLIDTGEKVTAVQDSNLTETTCLYWSEKPEFNDYRNDNLMREVEYIKLIRDMKINDLLDES